ncbi:MAG TPA: cation transporter, partial [Acidimicrobiales bacterium]|nr:cation transporter [Acidimicrobiales bacterium]
MSAMGVDTEHVDLRLTGMTCASCAARVEKKLNRLAGVTATVNFATETAACDIDPAAVTPSDLITAVESIGYGASVPAPHEHQHGPVNEEGLRALRTRVLVSALFAVPVVAIAMIP